MITVTIGNNVKRQDYIFEKSTSLRAAYEKANVDYTQGVGHLDGAALMPGDLDKTFEDFGIKERCFLLNVVKADGG